jgi:hypothetical protein
MRDAFRWIGAVAVGTLLLPVAALLAGNHSHACSECGGGVCRPVAATLKEKKHTWEVECKQICIPAPRWPWELCCEPKCGKVKTVKLLKKVEYECEKCGYQWEIHGDACRCGK